MGERRERQSRAMLVAVNRDLKALPAVANTALAELARGLARRVDAGELRAVGELRRTLVELQRLVAPKPQPRSRNDKSADVEPGQEVADDDLDAIKAERATRRDELARRRSRRAGAPVHDGTEPRPAARGDGGR